MESQSILIEDNPYISNNLTESKVKRYIYPLILKKLLADTKGVLGGSQNYAEGSKPAGDFW